MGLDRQFAGAPGRTKRSGVTGIGLLLDRLERDEFDLVAVARAHAANLRAYRARQRER